MTNNEVAQEIFNKFGPALDLRESTRGISFKYEGKRNSVAIYTIWGDNVINVWFGKSDSDSGGLAEQCNFADFNRIEKLHKRFMESGRRKVLRNYKK